ncbi:uncharacterized protein LOC117170882 [Belonocnema kinseyi]|uniref:uncharacterized protein LOC117170882 n=1 Tax=Belonocnema kinseyi TaxID=2817044 RepID=UPI00143D3E33|nr:uncharacterized protein LOC117170882 [Belonocnema kinseyi]
MAVFVCFASKGIDFEAVGDLSTGSLQGALLRFCVRRGKPAELWSDNATHFCRADLEIKEALSAINWDRVAYSMATEGILWQFIPPAAPHFGGLLEAGVKSFKTHHKRIAEPKNLTYEEFSTVLVNIETVLNCRPLSPLFSNVEDLDALTPRHLLIGGPFETVPEIPVEATNLDRLTHWKLVKGMRAQFWKRRSSEYLNTLQQRLKWTLQRPNLKFADLVILLDPSLIKSDGRWPLDRVTQAHEGSNGLMLAPKIQTCTGEYIRPIVKVSLLPIAQTTTEEGRRR